MPSELEKAGSIFKTRGNSMNVLSNFGLKPVKETISLVEKVDLPLYRQAGSYNNYKERVDVEMRGVKNGTVIHNKSDYTQRGEK